MSAPFIPFGEGLVNATFLRREKRFIAHVVLADGSAAIAHCPNTGSMRTCLEEGAPAILQRSDNPARKLGFTLKAVCMGGVWVGIDTGLPNRLAEEAVRSGFIEGLSGYEVVEREKVIVPGTRIDLKLSGAGKTVCFVEVKNVTLVEGGVARFPDAVTERGLKHLEELARFRAEGGRSAMVYVVQRGDGAVFTPADDIDPAYGKALRSAASAGVEIYALGAEVFPDRVAATGLLPVRLR